MVMGSYEDTHLLTTTHHGAKLWHLLCHFMWHSHTRNILSFFCLRLRLHSHSPQHRHSTQSTKWFCFLVFCLVVDFEWNCLWLLGLGNRRSFSTKLWAGIQCSWLVIGLRPHMKRVVTVTCCLSFLYLVFLFLILFVLAK